MHTARPFTEHHLKTHLGFAQPAFPVRAQKTLAVVGGTVLDEAGLGRTAFRSCFNGLQVVRSVIHLLKLTLPCFELLLLQGKIVNTQYSVKQPWCMSLTAAKTFRCFSASTGISSRRCFLAAAASY